MTSTVEILREFTVDNLDASVLQVRAEELMRTLIDLELSGVGLTDSTVRVDPVCRSIEGEVIAVGATSAEATDTADWCIRAAVHMKGDSRTDGRLELHSQRRTATRVG